MASAVRRFPPLALPADQVRRPHGDGQPAVPGVLGGRQGDRVLADGDAGIGQPVDLRGLFVVVGGDRDAGRPGCLDDSVDPFAERRNRDRAALFDHLAGFLDGVVSGVAVVLEKRLLVAELALPGDVAHHRHQVRVPGLEDRRHGLDAVLLGHLTAGVEPVVREGASCATNRRRLNPAHRHAADDHRSGQASSNTTSEDETIPT